MKRKIRFTGTPASASSFTFFLHCSGDFNGFMAIALRFSPCFDGNDHFANVFKVDPSYYFREIPEGAVHLKVKISGRRLKVSGPNIKRFTIYLKPILSCIMKQIAIRLIPGAPAVFDVVFGELKDGQFTPTSCDQFDPRYVELISISPLLGTSAYLEVGSLSMLVHNVLHDGGTLSLYSGFIVLTVPENVTKKEKDAR